VEKVNEQALQVVRFFPAAFLFFDKKSGSLSARSLWQGTQGLNFNRY